MPGDRPHAPCSALLLVAALSRHEPDRKRRPHSRLWLPLLLALVGFALAALLQFTWRCKPDVEAENPSLALVSTPGSPQLRGRAARAAPAHDDHPPRPGSVGILAQAAAVVTPTAEILLRGENPPAPAVPDASPASLKRLRPSPSPSPKSSLCRKARRRQHPPRRSWNPCPKV